MTQAGSKDRSEVAERIHDNLQHSERYDSDRGVLFESFALLRIRGAMLDALRSLDWVPRSVRVSAREVERAEASLGLELGRLSIETALAAGLELDIGELRRRLLEIYNSRIYSFDAPLPSHGENGAEGESSMLDVVAEDHDSSNPEEALALAEETGDLSTVISAVIVDLPERQQFIPSCRYNEDLRLGEISEVLGISEWPRLPAPRQPPRWSECSVTVNLHPGPPCLGVRTTSVLEGPDASQAFTRCVGGSPAHGGDPNLPDAFWGVREQSAHYHRPSIQMRSESALARQSVAQARDLAAKDRLQAQTGRGDQQQLELDQPTERRLLSGVRRAGHYVLGCAMHCHCEKPTLRKT